MTPEKFSVLHKKPPLAQVPTSVTSHHQSLSIELDHLLTFNELAPSQTHSSHLPLDATSPLFLLDILCEDLVANEIDQSLHEKYQRAQTLLQFWNETPVIGTLWNTLIGSPIGTYIEGDLRTSFDSLNHQNRHLNPHPSVQSKNHFDLEPLEELTFAPQLRTPTNPFLHEHDDILRGDISSGHATLNLHRTLAALKDLFPPLHQLLGPLARPQHSTLFQVELPVQLTAEQAIERSYQDSIDRLREPPRTHLVPTPRKRVFADYILQPCHIAAAEATEYQVTANRVTVAKRKENFTHQNPRRTKKARKRQLKN